MGTSSETATGIWAAFMLSSLTVGVAVADETAPTASSRTLQCVSDQGERRECPADTSAGVALVRSIGSTECLLGKNWGYDDAGVWVTGGCGGEFIAGHAAATKASGGATNGSGNGTGSANAPTPSDGEQWGWLDAGKGFLIGRSNAGELSISGYALLRYLDQTGKDTFTDHFGRQQSVDLRRDIYSHRILVFLRGWMGIPKLSYVVTFWTVNTTNQVAIFGNLGYHFSTKLNLYAGVTGNPGSRSLLGSHPYWLGTDRVMADEFFRPFFTQGIWVNGELVPGLWYDVTVGNSNSILGITAAQLDRKFTTGGSVWWMPTTKEFGPRGGYGDWEMHEKLATRFGISTVSSPEQRFAPVGTDPGNTSLRLADSLNLFGTGSLAPGVTISDANYRITSLDAGFKLRGFFLQTELYHRVLDNFNADGPLPVQKIVDNGFYVQAAFYPIPRKLELYAATSQIYGDKDAGFGDSSEVLAGLNYYPANTRNHRINFQIMNVNRSPVSSTFGYYTAGQDGTSVSVAASIFF
jgi:hypothetical protein